MGFIHNIFHKRGSTENVEITDLKGKVDHLEKLLQSDFPLVAVDDGNYVTYNIENNNYYNTNYAVNRAINLLANNIAALPLKLFRGEQELPISHVFPNGFSFSRPNTEMSLSELLYTTCIYYFYRGEFCQQIITEDGPMRLVPLNPKTLTRDQNGNWKLNKRNRITIIQKEELIYTAFLNPEIATWNSNGGRGLSPVDVVRAELKNDAAACNYNTKYFENFGKLGGILIDKDGNITPAQMNKLVVEFNASHQGQNKSYKTLGLPKGISYEDISQTLREMDFLSSRKDVRDRILIVLGVHPALVGVTDQVNRSVAEEAGRQMWSQTLKPAAIRIQEKYNQQLLNHIFPGYRCKFDFSEIAELQENMESILKQAVEFKKLGYTTNEINTHFKLGMEEITDPEGTTRYVPVYLRTLEQLDMQVTPPKLPPEPKKAVDKLVDLLEENKSAAGDKYRQTYLRRRGPLEKKFNSKMKRYFFEMRKDVLKIVVGSKHNHNITNDLVKYFNDADIKIKEVTEPLYVSGAELGIDIANTQVKIVSNSINKDVMETSDFVDMNIVQSYLNKVTNINHTIHNQIKLSVWENAKEGGTMDELSKEIKNIFNVSSARSKAIARTESSGIINTSTNERYKGLGITRTAWCGGQRPLHAATNGSVVNLGEEFSCGLKFPGDQTGSGSTPANLINCRCCSRPIVEGD